MRHSFSLLFSLLLTIPSFAQLDVDEANYMLVPEITKKIRSSGKAVEFEKAEFRVYREYDYEDGIIYGSWIRFQVLGIEEKYTMDDQAFIIARASMRRKDDGEVMYDVPWYIPAYDGKLKKADGTGDLMLVEQYKIGQPMYEGTYIWEIELADVCSGKTSTHTTEFKVIPHPTILKEEEGDLTAKEVYVYNKEQEYVYCVDSIHRDEAAMVIYGIDGLKGVDGVAQVGFSVEFLDERGNVIFKDEDVAKGSKGFIELEEDGTTNAEYSFRADSNVAGQYCTFRIRIWDKRAPDNAITGTALFYVR